MTSISRLCTSSSVGGAIKRRGDSVGRTGVWLTAVSPRKSGVGDKSVSGCGVSSFSMGSAGISPTVVAVGGTGASPGIALCCGRVSPG
jgi:hypothetical protein